MKDNQSNNILVLYEMNSIIQRIRPLFENINITILEASNSIEFFNIMSLLNNNIATIIIEMGFNVEKTFKIIADIKQKNLSIPIVILTSNNKRELFVKSVLEGVSDYILKPFDDEVFIRRVSKFINKNDNTTSDNENIFDMQNYLNIELKKAKKGNYETTVMLCTFFIPEDEIGEQIDNLNLNEYLYTNLKSIIWDTDIFENYANQTFIGFFPFCGLEGRNIISKKLIEKFQELKTENSQLDKYHFSVSCVSFPSDASDSEQLLTLLSENLNKSIEDSKLFLVQRESQQ